MPKESFFGEQPNQGTSEWRPNRLDIAWGNNHEMVGTGEVSIGVLKHPGPDGDVQQYVDDGFWVAVDRNAINRLIKTLRKARDQAFGPDE